jgi:toxoflavin biosynthesis protein ToxC
MIEHRSPISGIDAFAGRLVATAGYDNQVILWNAAEKTAVARGYHDHLANHCRFSVSGNLLVTASSDYTARIWQLPAMQLITVLTQHSDDVEMAAISRDERKVATASRDHLIRIFDIKGNCLSVLDGHSSDVLSVEWIRDGAELVSSGDDGTICRWSAHSGSLIRTEDLGGSETDTIAVASSGTIYAGNDDGQIIVLDGEKKTLYSAHEAGIKRIVLGEGNGILLSTSYDRRVGVWRINDSGQLELKRRVNVPPDVWVRSAAFLTKYRVVFGTFGSSYATLDLETSRWDLSLVQTTSGLNAVMASGGHVLAVGDSGIVYENGRPIATMGSGCNFLGGWFDLEVTGGQSGTLFNARTGEKLYQHHSPLNCCARFKRCATEFIVVGAYTGECIVLRRNGKRLINETTIKPHHNAIKGLACNDDEMFSVCATGGAASVSLSTLQILRSLPSAHTRISNGAAVLPDGRFASVSRDRKLRIWHSGGVEIFDTPFNHSIKCVASAKSSTLVALGSYGGMIGLFDWREKQWVKVTRPTMSGISSLCYGNCDGEFLASSYDGMVYTVKS